MPLNHSAFVQWCRRAFLEATNAQVNQVGTHPRSRCHSRMMTEGAVSAGIIGGLVSLGLTPVLADGEDSLAN